MHPTINSTQTHCLTQNGSECNKGEIKVDNSTDIDIDIIDIDIIDIVHFHRKYHQSSD